MVIRRILLLMFKHNFGTDYNTRHCSSLHPAIGKSEATYIEDFLLSCNFFLGLFIKINMYACRISLL